jgi:hypothetical protein
MGGNPSPSSLNEDFSNIFDYDIVFKLWGYHVCWTAW